MMRHICPHCSNRFVASICKDKLGWYTSCPECGGSFDIDTTDCYDVLRSMLISIFTENREDMKEGCIEGVEKSNIWKQAKDVFIALTLLKGYDPDTSTGDTFLSSIYYEAGLEQTVDIEDFDLFMWSDLT